MLRLLLGLLLLIGVVTNASATELVPPVLVQKQANQWPVPPPGIVYELDAPTSTTFSLYIPHRMHYDGNGETTLTIHFHGASWFMRQEHAVRGATHPLITANAKEGDAVYEADIMARDVLASLLAQTEVLLRKSGGPPNTRVGELELSGFSAGYAGVRGVLRLPLYEPRVSRVLLSDSLYIGDGPDSAPPDKRIPRMGVDGLAPILAFARKAAASERTLLMEFSSTPSMRSVGPMDCARAIIAELGLSLREVVSDSLPAARQTADYQLVWRTDAGNAHFWCYDSPKGLPIHLAHVRNIGMMWRSLDGLTSTEAIPPPIAPRPINPGESMPGEVVDIDIATSGTVKLFLPTGYSVPKSGAVELNIHFHGATWFVIQEHLRRGMGEPLVVLELGQGSSVYRTPFEDPDRFSILLDAVVAILQDRGAPAETYIQDVNLTSFSAGYGAVRELVKSEANRDLIKRIVLGDSSYGSLDETALAEGRRVVIAEHVECWLPFARLALSGEKTLLFATSEIAPETYAGTHEVARAVAEALGLHPEFVKPDSIPAAASGLEYPLNYRADSGSFHWWGYGGNDAVVHMTLARHIGDAWVALDQTGDP